ncbi:MAG TPA: hypothetical protein VLA42_11125 [Verrucomicrobiae bacterium]|jgi:hypothetical protein|nr:hypothetical protein [Verrucomicrobiae bacterium]
MPLSIDAQLRDALKLRDISTRTFAAIAKLEGIKNASQPQLDKAFKETAGGALSGDTAEKLWGLWCELELMVFETYAFSPWAVMALDDGERVHTSLQIFRGCQTLRGKEDETNSGDEQ